MKLKRCRLPWVRLRGDAIAIYIQAVYYVSADQFDGHPVANIDLQFRWRVGELPRIDPKGPLLRRDGRDW